MRIISGLGWVKTISRPRVAARTGYPGQSSAAISSHELKNMMNQ